MPKIISSETKERPFRPRTVKAVSLFVCETAVNDIIAHAESGSAENKEVMGLLMGSGFRDDIGDYVIVRDVATSDLNADEVSVKFEKDGFEQLFESMDSCSGEDVVGWYHSHPGFGCYMSEVDIKTHTGIFGTDSGFAIVIDPSDSAISAFVCEDGGYEKVPMIIMDSD